MKIPDVVEKKSFEGRKQIAWDSTSISSAMTCPRKYYYDMILGIKPREQSHHLTFGIAYANAMEKFYTLLAEGKSVEDSRREVIRQALIETWDAEENKPVELNDDKKTRDGLIRTIVWYIEEYEVHQEPVYETKILENGKPATELSFSIEFDDEYLFCGHLDRVVVHGGFNYALDNKTTAAALSDWYFATYNPNNQVSGYSWAAEIILETPIQGVIIDAAQVQVHQSQFARRIIPRTKGQLKEWWESARYYMQLTNSMNLLGKWPMNTESCGKYGGCPFRPLCQEDPRVREGYERGNYIPHKWDPLEER